MGHISRTAMATKVTTTETIADTTMTGMMTMMSTGKDPMIEIVHGRVIRLAVITDVSKS